MFFSIAAAEALVVRYVPYAHFTLVSVQALVEALVDVVDVELGYGDANGIIGHVVASS